MAKMVKEMRFVAPNKVGVLDDIARHFKKARINLLHAWAWTDGRKGYLGVVSSSNARAKKILKKLKMAAKEKEVLMTTLPNRAGALARITAKLTKAKINIKSLTATSASKGKVGILIDTSNNKKAKKLL